MGVLFVFIILIYVAVRILKEQSGMGDFYRSMGDNKRANESDSAVAAAGTIIAFIVIIIILALLGAGQQQK